MLDTPKYDLLAIDEINSYLKSCVNDAYHFILFPTLDSTNTYILDNINTLNNNTVVAAEMQTSGRGQFANKWVSENAFGLTISVLKFFPLEFNTSLLSLVIAIAVHRLLTEYNIEAKIKWPNDICDVNGNKIAGILLESGILNSRDFKVMDLGHCQDNKGNVNYGSEHCQPIFKSQRFIVIGIGINNHYGVKRSMFLACLIKHLDRAINDFIHNGFAILEKEWLVNCIHYNKTIGVYQNGKLVASGTNVGLSDTGGILVKTADGDILEYRSASLRFEIN